MCKGLIGKKLGMTGIFTSKGEYIPVTVVQVGPCVVTQVKTVATDGYNALQIGFGPKKPEKTTMPLKGHFEKSGGNCYSVLKEVAVDNPEEYKVGQTVSLELFKTGEKVNVIGTSKGRGFAGVMKRHGFSGGRKTHGSHSHRIPGSIGCSAWPAKVIKGKKMPGHFGTDRITVKNLEVIDVRPDENLLLIKGAVPGYASGIVMIEKPKVANKR